MYDQEAVRRFIDQVRWLYEGEFGDFKRKVGLYLQRMEEADPELKSGPSKEYLNQIRNLVMYSPNGDIESTRRQVLFMAEKILSGGTSAEQTH
jgi:hypothetical protein